jgi:hypothetical protein
LSLGRRLGCAAPCSRRAQDEQEREYGPSHDCEQKPLPLATPPGYAHFVAVQLSSLAVK